ncbi:MAG: hypothetical protein AAFY44_17120, partial [Pseudomonadota bacterium]
MIRSLVSAFLVAVCSTHALAGDEPPLPAIYAAVLSHLELDNRPLAIKETVAPVFLEDSDLVGLNPDSARLSVSPEDFVGLDVKIVGNTHLIAMGEKSCEEGWQFFRDQFPGHKGMLGLGLVGVSTQGERVAVYLDVASDCLGGQGWIFSTTQDFPSLISKK